MDDHYEPAAAPAQDADVARQPEADATKLPRKSPVFYQIDIRACTAQELWRGTRSPMFLWAWIALKWARVRPPASLDDPATPSLGEFEVAKPQFQPTVAEAFGRLGDELESLGFRDPVFHAIDDHVNQTGTYTATFSHPNLPVVARSHLRIWVARTPPSWELFSEYLTADASGRFAWTVSSNRMISGPPTCTLTNKRKATPTQLLDVHRAAVDRAGLMRPYPVPGAAEARAVTEVFHAELRDFHLQRGLFALPSQEEAAKAGELAAAYRSGELRNPATIAEMNALLTRKSSWVTAIVLLIVSLAIFLGIGAPGARTWGRALALVLVLLFHESGHYLAMKVFGYRNLRMFFIPGFGAAVSGRAFNVPGWKKVVVSLMGPVPGIILGVIVGLCGMVGQWPIALDAGAMLVLINGFNLLPILPLDGGHVVHTIVFSRSFVLDAIFRIAAALGLLAMSVLLPGAKIFMFLAIGMLVTLPMSMKVAKVARKVRAEGLDTTSPDDQTVPPVLADRIVEALKEGNKKPIPNKLMAQQALQVYETINTRPPGWLASFGLGTVHLGSLLIAVVFSLVFIVAHQGGGFGSFFRAAAHGPRHKIVAPASVVRPAGPALPESAAAEGVLVATFPSGPKAADEFQRLTAELKPGERLTLLGDTIMLRGIADSADRKSRLDALQAAGADAFIDGPQMGASFRFHCIAPDEKRAAALVEEIDSYTRLPLSAKLVAPWSRTAVPTAREQLARKTYARLTSVSAYKDPAMQDLTKKIDAARRRGDGAEAKALGKRREELSEELRHAAQEKIASEDPLMVDADLARRFIALEKEAKPEDLYQTRIKELGPRLGSAINPDGTLRDPTCARSGWGTSSGMLVRLEGFTFERPDEGAPRVVEWLKEKGMIGIRYDVEGHTRYEDGSSDED